MSLVVQVIVTGLAAGGIYGVFAVGYSLVYRLTGVVYFAFGDLVSFAVFAMLLVAAGTAPVNQTSLAPGRFLVALLVGLLLCVGVGAATYILFIEPYLLRGSTLGWVAATLAIAFSPARPTSSRTRFPSTRWGETASSRWPERASRCAPSS